MLDNLQQGPGNTTDCGADLLVNTFKQSSFRQQFDKRLETLSIFIYEPKGLCFMRYKTISICWF